MTTQEFNLRLIVIDDAIVLMMTGGNRPQILDDKRAKQALRFLGLHKEPVAVPNRSFELAGRSDAENDDRPITGIGLQLLSLLAEYKDPIGAAQIAQLGTFNSGTMSSRLSVLKARGFLSASGTPHQYMLTSKGHAALIASANLVTANAAPHVMDHRDG